MPSNSSSFPTSCQKKEEEEMEQYDKEKEEENDGVGSFFVNKRDKTQKFLIT